MQVQFSSKSKLMNSVTLYGDLSAGASIEVLGDAITGYIVNVVREKGEEAVRIPSSISAKLKAHQVFFFMVFRNFLYEFFLFTESFS